MQIVLSRLREFYREPEAVFWVYGFPILMVVALGIAFRNQPDRPIAVDIEAGPAAEAVRSGAGEERALSSPRRRRSRPAASDCGWARPIWS